jgi:hypothetical protein
MNSTIWKCLKASPCPTTGSSDRQPASFLKITESDALSKLEPKAKIW